MQYDIDIINFDFHLNMHLESLFLKIKISNRIYAFGVFYRPPTLNFNSIISDFDNIFSTLYPTVNDIVCLGDFNIDLLNLSNPLTTLFENYNLSQIIQEPTRVSKTCSTLLDAIFVTNLSSVQKNGVILADIISDHKVIYCELNLSKIATIPKFIKYRCFKNFSYPNFLSDLHQLPWNDILYENIIDNKISMFNNLVITLFDRHAPFREARVTKHQGHRG